MHPLVDGAPPLALQYVDDTLIIMRAELGAVRRLKDILDDFVVATGLIINFHKSTVVPMHVQDDDLRDMVQVLGCGVGSFPQVYLGLPLSNRKLSMHDFLPLIAKAECYLSGWRAQLLSFKGRLVLLNAVLDALPTYAMAAMELPPSVLRAIDALCRSFLWTASDKASGAQCLVAWGRVVRPKEEGWRGVCALPVQNRCLLMKLLYHLHLRQDAPWARRVWTELGRSLLTLAAASSLPGPHWSSLDQLMPVYRAISRISIGDRCTTAFWLDSWLPGGALSV